MTDENNPTIYVEYSNDAFPPATWWSLLDNAIKFKIKNSGIMKTPELTLTLKNKNGEYTGGGSPTLTLNKILRVRADVRGTIDTLFYGRMTEPPSNQDQEKREILTITARGMLQKLLNDTITKNYAKEQQENVADRSMKQVIEHFLATPDSGYSTGISLVTDSGDITTVKTKHDFNRASLLEAIQQICEYISYAGYEEVSGSNINVNLYPYGWQATDPVITINENDDGTYKVLEREFSKGNLDDVYNHLFIWGMNCRGAYPQGDYCTEGGVALGYWTALNGECTVTDEPTEKKVNNKSIKITKVAGTLTNMGATCTFPAVISVTTNKLTYLSFLLKSTSDVLYLKIHLIDGANKEITWIQSLTLGSQQYAGGWVVLNIPLGTIYRDKGYMTWHEREVAPEVTPTDVWYAGVGVNFNWENVTKVKFDVDYIDASQACTWYIDGLHFEGAIAINPILDTGLQVYDSTSITNYGRRVLHLEEESLDVYSLLNEYGQKILLYTKNPVPKLTVKVGAKTWVKPNQYVTVNMPRYGISTEQWRIMEIEYDWSTDTKMLHSKLSLTPRTQPVTGKEWYRGQVEAILKEFVW